MQWNGGFTRIGHCQVKNFSFYAHACDKLAGELFCQNEKFDLENLGQRYVVDKRYLCGLLANISWHKSRKEHFS